VVDVAVVGAGAAGCAAAATLARAGRSVLLLDARLDGFRVGEGAPPGLGRLLEEIFGAGAFDSGAHIPCPSIVSAWGSPEPGVVEHVLNPLGHAWNLDRKRFDADLRSAAARQRRLDDKRRRGESRDDLFERRRLGELRRVGGIGKA